MNRLIKAVGLALPIAAGGVIGYYVGDSIAHNYERTAADFAAEANKAHADLAVIIGQTAADATIDQINTRADVKARVDPVAVPPEPKVQLIIDGYAHDIAEINAKRQDSNDSRVFGTAIGIVAILFPTLVRANVVQSRRRRSSSLHR